VGTCRLQSAAVDDDARHRPAGPADAEWRDDDIGGAAILLQGRRVADESDGLALHFADAAK
jgi:hypothetical protein